MLSTPKSGWTTFKLGIHEYELSYLTDIAIDWIKQAIHGLETLEPFTVHGFLEPWRMLCTVSYWNTHIFLEDDENIELDSEESNYEIVHIKMIDFCQMLYDDIKNNIEEWAKWDLNEDANIMDNKKELEEGLSKLQIAIDNRKQDFSSRRFFC